MRTLLALLIAILTASLIFLLSGCGTIYKVKTMSPDGKSVQVSVWSGAKDFVAPDLHYSKSEIEGVDFSFKAESVTDQSAAFMGSFMQGLMSGRIVVNPDDR